MPYLCGLWRFANTYVYNKTKGETQMAEMKNICGKIPVELHEKVRAEIEEKETSVTIKRNDPRGTGLFVGGCAAFRNVECIT